MRWAGCSAGFVALTLTLLYTSGAAKALEPPKVFRGALVLEGQINAGDYDRVRRFLGKKNNFEKISAGVFLASPGGNVLEAMSIGYLLRSLELKTIMPTPATRKRPAFSLIGPRDLKSRGNFLCASACFFIYIAGNDREPKQVGLLGIHRPTLKAQVWVKDMPKDRAAAAIRIRKTIAFYMRQMGVSDKLNDLMYSVPTNKVHWFTKEEFSALIRGRTPKLTAALDQKCGPKIKSSADAAGCRKRTEIELAAKAWQTTYDFR